MRRVRGSIGSGGNYALAAAKVLMETDISAEEVARKAIKVAVGNTPLEKIIRLIDKLYGPIGRWRLRSGNTRFLVELPLYKLVNNLSKAFTPNFGPKEHVV